METLNSFGLVSLSWIVSQELIVPLAVSHHDELIAYSPVSIEIVISPVAKRVTILEV